MMANKMDKCFTSAVAKEFDDKERSVTAWASKPTIDRDGEIIKASAWFIRNDEKGAPSVPILLGHDQRDPLKAVGRTLWLKKSDEGLLFKASFADTNNGREAYTLYKEGILNSFSVGFMPIEWEDGKPGDKAHRVYTKAELLEISCVSIPSNPDAMIERIQKGLSKDIADQFTKILTVTKPEPAGEVKAMGLNGTPSIFDIIGKIGAALSATPDGMSAVYVEDVFPVTATSGFCIVSFSNEVNNTRSKYWHYDYHYNAELDTVNLVNPIAVEEVYKPKSFDGLNVKAGRELSGKNVSLLKDVSGKMKETSDMIDGLLDGKSFDTTPDTEVKKQVIVSPAQAPAPVEKEVKKYDTISIDEVKKALSGFVEDVKSSADKITGKDAMAKAISDEIKKQLGILD